MPDISNRGIYGTRLVSSAKEAHRPTSWTRPASLGRGQVRGGTLSTRRFAVGALLGSLLLALAPAAQGDDGASCKDPIAVDYLTPFRQMPQLRQPRRNGPLPFAPGDIRGTRGEPEVQTGRGRIGFAFLASRIPKRGLRVGWRVAIEVVRLDSQGQVVRRVRRKREVVRRIWNNRQLDFTVRANLQRGLYRYQIELRDKTGSRLAKYGQYLRVMKPRFRVALDAMPGRVRAGNEVALQVTNFGSVAISYAANGIQRQVDGQWVSADFGSHDGVRRRPISLLPGRRGPCRQLEIPEDAPAGLYRAQMLAYTQAAKRPRTVSAQFAVSPAS